MKRRYSMNFDIDLSGAKQYDCIIVGSGVAGLFTALSLDQSYRILILSKSNVMDSNSSLAQGGIAAAMHSDDISVHIEDTLRAGSAYNDKEAVRTMIEEAYERIQDMLKLGVELDCDASGNLLSTREGGHTARRVLHYKDFTGEAITSGLLKAAQNRENIEFAQHTTAVDILEQSGQAVGILAVHMGTKKIFTSRNVVLATGGIGGLYTATTNTGILTGDGIGMAIRAHIDLKDMEFIQFHPTAFSNQNRTFLISEAVRGEGGYLINSSGKRFMDGLHPLKELAPRDIVAEAMFEQMRQGETLYLDVRHLDRSYLKSRFPTIYSNCLEEGYDLATSPVPVRPVQHYIMGGILTDINGNTSMKGLYACGEVACTGVHGANRLASNSLLEGLVFGKRVAQNLNESLDRRAVFGRIAFKLDNTQAMDVQVLKDQIKSVLTKSAFIIRKPELIEQGRKALKDVLTELEYVSATCVEEIEVLNMACVAEQIIVAASRRPASLGSHIVS